MGKRQFKKIEDYFFYEIGQTEMLSREETRTLIEQYKEKGSGDALNKIIVSHLRLLVGVGISCRQWYDPEFITVEELVYPGTKGLEEAVRMYDVSRGMKFTNFARKRIFSKMARYICKHRYAVHLPEHKQYKTGALLATDLCQKTQVKEEGTAYSGISEDVLYKPTEKRSEKRYIVYHDVWKILSQLSERERCVLVHRIMHGRTLTETGAIAKISHETVRTTLKTAKESFRSIYG